MLDDLLKPNLRLVICGTAAGTRSAERREYYAGRGNRFWPTLFAIGLTPRQLAPSEWRELLTFGIGLTDVVKGQAGMDRKIDFRRSSLAELHDRIGTLAPRVVCFNGKRAAQIALGQKAIEFGWQSARMGETAIYCAPSTSGAAAGYWTPQPWRELATWLDGERGVSAGERPQNARQEL